MSAFITCLPVFQNGILHHLACSDVSGDDDDLLKPPPSEEVADLKRQVSFFSYIGSPHDSCVLPVAYLKLVQFSDGPYEATNGGKRQDNSYAASPNIKIRTF